MQEYLGTLAAEAESPSGGHRTGHVKQGFLIVKEIGEINQTDRNHFLTYLNIAQTIILGDKVSASPTVNQHLLIFLLKG